MSASLYPPAVAAKVTHVSEEMQRSLRTRFLPTWDHPIGIERNGRWFFTESDLIALASYSMHLHCDTSARQASHYAALLRKALDQNPDAEAVTISVGWPGDRFVFPAAMPFEADAQTPGRHPVHFNMTIGVSQLRKFVRDGLAQIEASA